MLMWRIGLPLVALNLSLLAIPLAFVNPRASRSMNLVFAVFAYMVNSNLLGIVQAWVAQGRVRFEVGWWVLHVAMLGWETDDDLYEPLHWTEDVSEFCP